MLLSFTSWLCYIGKLKYLPVTEPTPLFEYNELGLNEDLPYTKGTKYAKENMV